MDHLYSPVFVTTATAPPPSGPPPLAWMSWVPQKRVCLRSVSELYVPSLAGNGVFSTGTLSPGWWAQVNIVTPHRKQTGGRVCDDIWYCWLYICHFQMLFTWCWLAFNYWKCFFGNKLMKHSLQNFLSQLRSYWILFYFSVSEQRWDAILFVNFFYYSLLLLNNGSFCSDLSSLPNCNY